MSASGKAVITGDSRELARETIPVLKNHRLPQEETMPNVARYRAVGGSTRWSEAKWSAVRAHNRALLRAGVPLDRVEVGDEEV